MQGWVSIHRQIKQHWLWTTDKPFDKRSAWIDLVLSANHTGNKFVLGTQLVTVQKGEFITSELKLMERWGWGKTKLRNFLKLLEDDGMITKKSTNKQTTITIVNYCLYQQTQTTDDTSSVQQTYNKQTADVQQTYTNNNEVIMSNNENTLLPSEILQISDRTPYQQITEAFNEICTSLLPVQQIDNTRRKIIKARYKDMGCSMDKVKEYFAKVQASDFLTGKIKREGKEPFKATFDWIIKSANYIKVIEGNYENKEAHNGHNAGNTEAQIPDKYKNFYK